MVKPQSKDRLVSIPVPRISNPLLAHRAVEQGLQGCGSSKHRGSLVLIIDELV